MMRRSKSSRAWVVLAAASVFVIAALLYNNWLLRSRVPAVTLSPSSSVITLPLSSAGILKGRSICEDSCAKAKDGVCDEGRHFISDNSKDGKDKELAILCDIGTDCTDCGSYTGVGYSTAWTEDQPPVQYNRALNVAMYAAVTSTSPSFLFAYTDWKKDIDVSHQMHEHRLIEGGISQVFHSILEGRCQQADGERALVLDIGANFGYFAIYAAMMGCRVIAWEPIPRFRAFFEWSVAANNLSHLITIRPKVVSHEAQGQIFNMSVPLDGSWGTASINGMNSLFSKEVAWFSTTGEAVDDVVSEPVIIMKVDVEGYEAAAMQSAKNLLAGSVSNIVLEYNPLVPEMNGDISKERLNLAIMQDLVKGGYTIVNLPDEFSKQSHSEGPLPRLREISHANLRYDEEDLKRQCKWNHSEAVLLRMEQYNGWHHWLSPVCNRRKPIFAHPKSFRSSFYMNTNIWAQRPDFLPKGSSANGKMQLGSSASVMDLSADATKEWFYPSVPGYGLGSFKCHELDLNMELLFRCPCTDTARCSSEQADMLKILTEVFTLSTLLSVLPDSRGYRTGGIGIGSGEQPRVDRRNMQQFKFKCCPLWPLSLHS